MISVLWTATLHVPYGKRFCRFFCEYFEYLLTIDLRRLEGRQAERIQPEAFDLRETLDVSAKRLHEIAVCSSRTPNSSRRNPTKNASSAASEFDIRTECLHLSPS